MGILDKFTKQDNRKNTTRGFYLGSTEAEAENNSGIQNLYNYFEDYLGVLPILNQGRFIITGRKGSGKSAIAKFIKDSSDKDHYSFTDLIKIQQIELEKLVQFDELNEFENKEAVLFEWIILVRLIRLLVKNEDAKYSKEYNKLKIFLERNSGIVKIDKFQIKEILEQKKYEVKIDVLRHIFGGIIGKYFDIKTTKAPFYKLINPLKEILPEVLSYPVNMDKEFLLLFDDLDINFKEDNKQSIKNITELIRIAKYYNTEMFKGTKAKIIIFLRDDIKRIIESHNTDTAKLFSSYEVYLNWYDHESHKLNENMTNLKRFINKRIEINFQTNNIPYDQENPWLSLVQNENSHYQGKTSFKFILDCTSYRPRDFILIFNTIGQEDFKYPLEPSVIKLLLKRFAAENLRELKNELSILFTSDQIKSLFIVLNQLQYSSWHSYKTIYDKLNKYNFNRSTNEVFEILCNYSILIYRDKTGKLFFNYRDSDNNAVLNKENFDFTLHKSVYIYFFPESID